MRNILITGGTGVLGTATVNYFLNQGDRVLVTDIRPAESDYLAGFKSTEHLHTHIVDGSDEGAMTAFAEQVNREYGNLDVLINIVGGFFWGLLADTPVSELDKMLHLNTRTNFVTTKAFLAQLKNSSQGRIINIGAKPALQGMSGMSAYALSKAAVLSLTQTLSEELKADGITVNAVLPSVIDTPTNRQDMPDADFSQWVKPQELASVIGFLASPEAGAVSGALLPVYARA